MEGIYEIVIMSTKNLLNDGVMRMITSRWFKANLLAAFVFMTSFGLTVSVLRASRLSAQTITQWTEPMLVAGEVEGSNSPAIATDPAGGIHVAWVSTIVPLPEYPDFKSTLIYYGRYDGATWTKPVDIIISPDQYSDAQQPSLVADKEGLLHLAWTSPNRFLYYTSAHALEANNSKVWSDSVELHGEAQAPTITIGPDGRLHVLYLSLEVDTVIQHISSEDGGLTWSVPLDVSEPISTTQLPFRLSELITAAFDTHGVFHVAWPWEGKVFYAQSKDNGATWSQPMIVDQPDPELDNGMSPPTLISVGIDNKDGIHLVWDASHNGRSCGRYSRWSRNGGRTWNDREEILLPMEGCLGWNNMVRDNGGTLHLIGIARDATGIVRFWQSYWTGTEWSQPVPILDVAVDDRIWSQVGPDRSRLAIADGNRLALTWFTNDGRIWYAEGVTDAPSIAPVVLQPIHNTPQALKTPLSSPVPEIVESATSAVVSVNTQAPVSTGASTNGFSLSPAFVGALSAVVVIAIVIGLSFRRRSL